MEPTAGMVLNAAGRRIEETGSARALLRKWFKPNELSHDVPARWVDYVKVLSSMDCVLPPDQRTLKEERGPEMLEVRFKPSTVLRPGCTLWQVQILEHVHWMRADWYSLLTRRELEVAEMLNRGAANKDIARDLNLSLYTVTADR
ncbi:MAG: response regulator transcription factor, partial [Myxococcaceae bacterium]